MEYRNLELFRKLFQDMLKNGSILETDIDLESESTGDEADQMAEDREKLLFLKLKGRKSFFLKKVQDALDRIDDGTFGVCEDCDNAIEEGRLFARPTATHCISCKEERERIENHIPYQKRSHTLGKSLGGDNVIGLPIKDENQDKIIDIGLGRRSIDLSGTEGLAE